MTLLNTCQTFDWTEKTTKLQLSINYLYIRMKKVLSLINYIIGMTTVIQSLIRKDINVSEHEIKSTWNQF